MGHRALLSHEQSENHKKMWRVWKYSHQWMLFLRSPKTLQKEVQRTRGVQMQLVVATNNNNHLISLSPKMKSLAMSYYGQWMLVTNTFHLDPEVMLFQSMFTDSNIVSQVTLGKTKVAYFITHELAPYFHNELKNSISECCYLVACFDESLNDVVQKG